MKKTAPSGLLRFAHKIPKNLQVQQAPGYPSPKRRPAAALFLAALLLGGCQSLTRTPAELALPRGLVVFSFDDGPNAQGDTTARLLEVLRKHEVRALFALLGENAERNPELVRRIREEGHGIINHGYSSRFSLWMGDAEFAANLSRGEAVISAALGEYPAPRLYRPQGGFYRPGQQRIWRDAGYTLVPGTARIYDAVLSPRDKDRAVAKLLGIIEKQGGGVILLHDGRDSHRQMAAALAQNPRGPYDRSWIPAAVEELIVLLEAKGYTLRGPALVFRE